MITIKRLSALLSVAMIASVMLCLAFTMEAEDSHAAVSKDVKAKAKKYTKKANKLVTVKGAKYCFSRKKVKTGLQKIRKNYYFFKKSDGKMIKNKTQKVSGKYWFFKKDGKRYDYALKHTGSANGNDAAGMVISAAKIKVSGDGTSDELRKAYSYIINKVSYGIVPAPSLSGSAWIGKEALRTAKDKSAKCYGYAALTYVTFKALGGSPELNVGKCNTRPSEEGSSSGEHAWVERQADDARYVFDPVFDSTRGKDMSFFEKVKTPAEGEEYFTIDGKDFRYYPEKTY